MTGKPFSFDPVQVVPEFVSDEDLLKQRIDKFMLENWGERCPDFFPARPQCEAWKAYDQFCKAVLRE